MNKLRLKSFFVLLIALLCICTVLAAVTGIYHANQLVTLTGQQAQSVKTTLLWQLGLVIVLCLFIAALALSVFQARFFTPLRQLRTYIDAIASGDLSQRIQPSLRDNELNQLFLSVRRMQESLIRTMSLMRNLADEVFAEIEEMIERNNSLVARVDGEASALQQTAASMEQLAGTVRQNADNAHQANQLAVTASEVAQRGGQAVGEVVDTMHAISASSNKISDIVGVIDSIAFQTNILALNAAVEAARAGEQGRGFAVVASEVRALAQRSAQAAREITDLIEDSVVKVSEGSTQVERAGSTMKEIVDSVRRVTDIMGEISAATIEQSTGIEQVNKAVSQMDHSTAQNAQILERALSAAHLLKNHASRLQENARVYRLPEAEIIDLGGRQHSRSEVKKEQLKKKTTAAAVAPSAQPSLANQESSATAQPPQKNQDLSHQLLRPDLSGRSRPSAEDDWEEF